MKKLTLYLMGSALVVNLIALAVCLVIFLGKREALCIKQETIYKTQYIDLGLPSGTLWADRNIGADTPEQAGDYFRFGETVPFTENSPEYFYDDIEENIAGTTKDAATVILGKGYKMPTLEQIKELILLCSWKWTDLNGVKGMKVTGPNGNSIFFPASGCRSGNNGSLGGVGSSGYCWSASAYNSYYCHNLYFYSSSWDWNYYYRAYGFPIRAVAKTN